MTLGMTRSGNDDKILSMDYGIGTGDDFFRIGHGVLILLMNNTTGMEVFSIFASIRYIIFMGQKYMLKPS